MKEDDVVKGHSDFMNTVFRDKRHRAYDVIIRQDKRVDYIYNKFKDIWVDDDAIKKFDRRI